MVVFITIKEIIYVSPTSVCLWLYCNTETGNLNTIIMEKNLKIRRLKFLNSIQISISNSDGSWI